MNSTVIPPKISLRIWAALMGLLLLTWGLAQIDLGRYNVVAALAIAVTKMLLVILFFMHVRYNTRLTWVFVAAGFIWFLILVDLSLSDYLTRGVVRGTYPNSFEVRQSPPSTPRPVQSIPKRETSETK